MNSVIGNLVELFESLRVSESSGMADTELVATPLDADARGFLACDGNRRASVLLSVPTSDGEGVASPGLVTEHLSVSHAVACRVRMAEGGTREGSFSILRCESTDPELTALFLRTVAPIVIESRSVANSGTLNKSIMQLVELFRSLTRPARGSVQGLWGELLMISHARDPARLARAWHLDPMELWDFSEGAERIEVKTTSGESRSHHFLLDQLKGSAECTIVIASIFVEPLSGGVSVHDLLRSLPADVRSDPVLWARILRVARETLGADWSAASGVRFDEGHALESARYYRAEEIPSPARSIPDAVTEVRFRASLLGLAPIPLMEIRGPGALSSALP